VEFILYNADANVPVGPLKAREAIMANQFSIEARPTAECRATESTRMNLRGPIVVIDRIENQAPYLVFGDNIGDIFGRDYKPGNYTISADFYSSNNLNGELVVSGKFAFEIIPCESCDFSDLTPGDFVGAACSISVFVTIPGLPIEFRARVFNSSNPGSQAQLGSPNAGCLPPGPGRGNGGNPRTQPNSSYWNCVPLGNLLIAQRSNTTFPAPVTSGFCITFTFPFPVVLRSMGILDVSASSTVRFTVRTALIPGEFDVHELIVLTSLFLVLGVETNGYYYGLCVYHPNWFWSECIFRTKFF
jgi:hypothetical protein